jgi:hypothetical protein
MGGSASKRAPDAAEEVAGDYSNREWLIYKIKQKKVQLVTLQLFIDFQKAGKPLPKCQDVPDKYVLDPDALTEEQWEVLEVIAISYTWIDEDHPDPNGYYLAILAKMADLFAKGKYEKTKCKDAPGRDEKQVEVMKMYTAGSADKLHHDGFHFGAGDGRPVGVFLDWTSVPQDRPKGSRAPEETAIFEDALNTINVWYAHKETHTWMLTCLPEGCARLNEGRDYGRSGWAFFEQCLGAAVSPSYKLLRIDASWRQMLMVGAWDEDDVAGHAKWNTHPGDYLQLCLDTMDTQRSPPLAPEHFNEVIDEKTYANDADADAILKPNYLQTFNTVIIDAEEVDFSKLGFDDDKARAVLKLVLSYCKRGTLKRLNMSECSPDMKVPLSDWASVAEEMALEGLTLEGCSGVSGNLTVLVELTNLTVLNLYGCKGVSGDLASLAGLTNLTMLDLGSCDGVTGNLATVAGLTNLTVLDLTDCKGVWGNLEGVAGMEYLSELYLQWCWGVSGDLVSVAELAHLKRLDLRNTRVTAPEGCPKGTDQYGNPALVYPHAHDCWELLESNPLRAALLRKKRRRQKAEEKAKKELAKGRS